MQGKRLFLSKNLHFYLKYSILTALDGTDDAEVLDGGAIGNGVERCHAVAGAADAYSQRVAVAVEGADVRKSGNADVTGQRAYASRDAEVGIHDGIHSSLAFGINHQLAELVPVGGGAQHVILLVSHERLVQSAVVGPCPLRQ